MFAILVMVLRYVFLLLLVFSVYKLVKWMIADLQALSSPQKGQSKSQNRSERLGKSSPRPVETNSGVELVVVESAIPEFQAGDTFPCGQETLLGRGERSNIIVAGSFASARHARVYFKEGQYWLEDLQSTNGTFLNEIQVNQPIVLANGDKIRIGSVIFQFVR